MGVDTSWDVEAYRTAYESVEHWNLKKEFMEAHKDRIQEDRLICLAQVFVNIELLGCKYPDAVMEEVAELARDVGEEYKEAKKKKLQRTFVKASDAAGARLKGRSRRTAGTELRKPGIGGPGLGTGNPGIGSSGFGGPGLGNAGIRGVGKPGLGGPGLGFGNTVSSGIDFVSPDSGDCVSSNVTIAGKTRRKRKRLNELCASYGIEVSGTATTAANSAFASAGPSNTSYIPPGDNEYDEEEIQNNVVKKKKQRRKKNISQEETNKNEDEEEEEAGSCSTVGEMMMKKMGWDGGGLGASGQGIKKPIVPKETQGRKGLGCEHSTKGKNKMRSRTRGRGPEESNDPLKKFVLVLRENTETSFNARAILNESTAFSKAPLEYLTRRVLDKVECTLRVGGVVVSVEEGPTKKKAEMNASNKAMEILPKRCYTIKIKKNTDIQHITVDQVKETESTKPAKMNTVAQNMMKINSVVQNIMKMMGYTGGGLGKDEQGITEPIKPSEVFGRQGLGHSNPNMVSPEFTKKIKEILGEYVASGRDTVLEFPGFTKEQRAEIHEVTKKFSLKSRSHGSGVNRVLNISNRVFKKKLLAKLLTEGSNKEFELIPPSSTFSPFAHL